MKRLRGLLYSPRGKVLFHLSITLSTLAVPFHTLGWRKPMWSRVCCVSKLKKNKEMKTATAPGVEPVNERKALPPCIHKAQYNKNLQITMSPKTLPPKRGHVLPMKISITKNSAKFSFLFIIFPRACDSIGQYLG